MKFYYKLLFAVWFVLSVGYRETVFLTNNDKQ